MHAWLPDALWIVRGPGRDVQSFLLMESSFFWVHLSQACSPIAPLSLITELALPMKVRGLRSPGRFRPFPGRPHHGRFLFLSGVRPSPLPCGRGAGHSHHVSIQIFFRDRIPLAAVPLLAPSRVALTSFPFLRMHHISQRGGKKHSGGDDQHAVIFGV